MKLFLDICLGLGLAQAAGIRPFTPAVIAGGFAAGGLFVDFEGTDFAFLQAGWWLLLMGVLAVAALFARDRLAAQPALSAALQGLGMGIGAVLFAGALADDGYAWWPGIPAGLAAAWLVGHRLARSPRPRRRAARRPGALASARLRRRGRDRAGAAVARRAARSGS